MQFKVENVGKGTRYVPTLTGRATVDPGEKNARKLNMDPEVARQYNAMAQRSEKMSIKVSGTDDESRDALSQPPQPRQRGRMPPDYKGKNVFDPASLRPPEPKQAVVKSPYDDKTSVELIEEEEQVTQEISSAKAELLSRADDMELDALRTEAQMVLGADWPKKGGNKFSRDKIKSLLAE